MNLGSYIHITSSLHHLDLSPPYPVSHTREHGNGCGPDEVAPKPASPLPDMSYDHHLTSHDQLNDLIYNK